jgi:hypothetical protein
MERVPPYRAGPGGNILRMRCLGQLTIDLVEFLNFGGGESAVNVNAISNRPAHRHATLNG